jgi:MFS family permease
MRPFKTFTMSRRNVELLVIAQLWLLAGIILGMVGFVLFAHMTLTSPWYWPMSWSLLIGFLIILLLSPVISRAIERSSFEEWATNESRRFRRYGLPIPVVFMIGFIILFNTASLLGDFSSGMAIFGSVFCAGLAVGYVLLFPRLYPKPSPGEMWWVKRFHIESTDLKNRLELIALAAGIKAGAGTPTKQGRKPEFAFYADGNEVVEVWRWRKDAVSVRIRNVSAAGEMKALVETAISSLGKYN